MRSLNPAPLWLLSALSAVAFVAVSRQVARGSANEADRDARDELQKRRAPAGDAVAHATNPLGKEWLHVPAAAALSLYIARKRKGTAHTPALVPLLASVAAEVSSRVFDRLPPHQRPPEGHPKPHKPSFPSGHALETTAVAGTTAYVLAREGLAGAPLAFGTAAALSASSTLGRLYLDRHWVSDALGGAALGLSIAAACAALYEVSAWREVKARTIWPRR